MGNTGGTWGSSPKGPGQLHRPLPGFVPGSLCLFLESGILALLSIPLWSPNSPYPSRLRPCPTSLSVWGLPFRPYPCGKSCFLLNLQAELGGGRWRVASPLPSRWWLHLAPQGGASSWVCRDGPVCPFVGSQNADGQRNSSVRRENKCYLKPRLPSLEGGAWHRPETDLRIPLLLLMAAHANPNQTPCGVFSVQG